MKRICCLFVALAVFLTVAPASMAFLDPTDPNVQKFTATEDDGFSRVGGETLVNRGKAGSVRCKSSQEMVIMKFDLSSLAGKTITEAELHVCASSSSLLYAGDVSTICVPWTEGNTAGSFTNGAVGEPCWAWRRIPADVSNPSPDDYWTVPGSEFSYASYGNNGSISSYGYPADGGFTTYTASTPGGTKTFYRLRLDPDIVHALVLDQYGLTFNDTRGYLLQNNTVYLRDQWGGAAGPWLYVKGAVTDTTPPGALAGLTAEAAWNGEVLLSWTAPTDSGPKGKAFGYDVRYSTGAIDAGNFAAATQAPRWRIPRLENPGTWRLEAQELITGLSAVLEFPVRPAAQGEIAEEAAHGGKPARARRVADAVVRAFREPGAEIGRGEPAERGAFRRCAEMARQEAEEAGDVVAVGGEGGGRGAAFGGEPVEEADERRLRAHGARVSAIAATAARKAATSVP